MSMTIYSLEEAAKSYSAKGQEAELELHQQKTKKVVEATKQKDSEIAAR